MCLIMALLSLSKSFESMSDIIYGKFQKLDRMDYISISMMVKGVSSFLLFYTLLMITRDLICALLGMTFVWAAVLFFYDLKILENYSKIGRFERKKTILIFKQLLVLSLPLTITTVLVSISGYMPRYFLEYISGKEAVGLFSVASVPLALINLFNGSIGQTIMNRATLSFQHGKYREFIQLTARVTAIFFFVSTALFLLFVTFGKEIILFLFSKQYVSAVPVMVILSLGYIVNAFNVFGYMVMVAGRMFVLQLVSIVVTLVIQLPLCYFLTKNYSIIGAGWADFLRNVVNTLFYLIAGFFAFKSVVNVAKKKNAITIR
jgi:O-antigen/teichoic acid export membrane protein